MVDRTGSQLEQSELATGTTVENTRGAGGNSDEHRQDVVSITINSTAYPIHRGRHSVAEIKKLGAVPQADELAQVIDGNSPPLTPLLDDGAVTIKGDEVFVSYPKDSGSANSRPA
jgi:hypothetical protein